VLSIDRSPSPFSIGVGSPLVLNIGVQLHATYAYVPDGLPLDGYLDAVAVLEATGRAHPWHLGDLLLRAQAVYGDAVYSRIRQCTGLEQKTLANYCTVAGRFASSRRRESIGWPFHEAVAHLKSDAQQDALLDQAVSEGWTRGRLRIEVRMIAGGFQPDKRGYEPTAPTIGEHALASAYDRFDVARLEASPWPSGEVDLLLTSPPYGVGKSYRHGGDVEGWDTYLKMVQEWARALHRMCHPGHGRLALNVPLDRADSTGARLVRDGVGRAERRRRPGGYLARAVYAHWLLGLEKAGFKYRSTIVWWDNTAGDGPDRGSIDSPSGPHIVAPCEMIILAYRGSWSRTSTIRPHDLDHQRWLEQLGPRGVWCFPGERDHSDHPAPWPEEVPERLIRLLSFRSDVIADPFCGRGTAGVVGARLGRSVWMGDRSEAYVAFAKRAVAEARLKYEPTVDRACVRA
jgi:site-specific DNA-methyltransferase (adenine-specific)